MKRFCTFITVLLGLVMPSHVMAGTPYTINYAWTQENPICEHAHMARNGEAFFDANGTPIPTFEVPGAFIEHQNGWESNRAEAGFSSVLLRMETNTFAFYIHNSSGDNSCVHSSNVVTLMSPQLGIEKLLFAVRRDGTAFSGETKLDLKLEEINPQLAQDIAILEEELAAERKRLVANADKIVDLDARLDALQQLETELGDLLTRPLDEISVDDLNEMLLRYSPFIDAATRDALLQVLADLKQSIVDLQTELASLIANFGDQADAVSDFLTGDARQNGFSPDDPSNYGLGPNDVPWVDVPDISNVPGAFDAGNDPYAAYADAVIALLQENVSGNKVIGRANFVAEVRAWRSNQAALEKAILARMSVSQAETSAFLNGQNKVTGYLQKFMNALGWFHDAPIPEDVRADVEGPLKNLYGALADQLQDALNAWDAKWYPESNLFLDTLRAFSAGMEAGEEIAQQYRDTMKTIVHGASRVAIGFVPFVGPALDLCEAVTGKEWCMPSGRTLTTGERVFSGIGFGIGKVVKVWSGVKTAAISAEGKAVAAGIVTLGDKLGDLAKSRFRSEWRLLKYADNVHVDIGELTKVANIYEREALRRLLEDEGHWVLAHSDKAVKDLLGIVNSGAGTDIACDFITITKNDMLVLSEVKGIINGKVDVQHALEQLKNVVKKLNEKNLADGKTLAHGVERVQIFVPKGSVTKFNGTFKLDGTNLINTGTNTPVTLKNQGRSDLIVQIVEMVEL